ncbi:MAG: Ribokinase [Candidatus Ozemobacter sibiricus]|jgi:ribokinase|uniref:Ribokinase n=1 Tax=Candidatus Ozemobacter sibiricus TaxID=2268124 RepID=A0A367ZSR6_9BACT|nr:MAG: Ribokinase [Candidatus Ozemobacter sibiricus]
MAGIVVCGLINYETTLRIGGFPLEYNPVNYPFHGIASSVSGVGFNVATALARLGNDVRFLSFLGDDPLGRHMRERLRDHRLADQVVEVRKMASPQSVILYDPAGRRQIHVDLKSVQELAYPVDRFLAAAQGCTAAALCNINFSRPLLREARRLGLLVATDVHAISSLEDEYNRDYMQSADLLFLSHEGLPCSPEEAARLILGTFATPRLVVIGLGHDGAVLGRRDDGSIRRFPAAPPPRVTNTIGAGDALFSSFLHWYLRDGDPDRALIRAQVFASLKIAGAGGADALPTEAEVEARLETLAGLNCRLTP